MIGLCYIVLSEFGVAMFIEQTCGISNIIQTTYNAGFHHLLVKIFQRIPLKPSYFTVFQVSRGKNIKTMITPEARSSKEQGLRSYNQL